jgi:HPt (histidine-containing phosphotransfer) domain-containing protein
VSISAPNDRLAGLVLILGDDDTRELVRLYLGSVPRLLADIGGTDRQSSQRAAHSLKSSSDQMGASGLWQQAKALEARIMGGGPLPSPEELAALDAEFRKVEEALRGYGGS